MTQFGIPGFQPQPQMYAQPGLSYNPLGIGQTGNQQMDMALAMVAMPMLQSFTGGKFLPQQFPAQNLLDQMTSAKWQQASMANLAAAQQTDRSSIARTMVNMRAATTDTPITDLQQSHINTFAGIMTNPFAMGLAEMALGPQNAEDLFFGRRGSATKLAQSANRIGAYRADAVSGRGRMSAESLKSFSANIYDNLYGPEADLNDVSGFSAGRVGDLMTALSQRGLLPASVSSLSAVERKKAFNEVGVDKMRLSDDTMADQAIKTAMRGGASIDEITKISGGAEAVRKVDATRVSGTIKQYTDALSAVREIFGDNGMANAPMQQLMAAMEALTQNSTSSMKADKIGTLMRRTQMASHDAGVSLETLMGLSARGGALADQYGLSRDLVGGSVITAIEHGKAMADTGRFAPAFGRMDRNKATLAVLDQSARADASPVGRYLAVASRLAAENEGNAAFKGSNMAKMVEAMQRGETTYFDSTQNRAVNIYEEFGRNPNEIMRRQLQEAGISTERFGALYRDNKNTQEFQVAGAARSAQAYELKDKLGGYLATQTGITDKIGGGLSSSQRAALSAQIGKGLSTALIDTVNNTMSPQERLKALRSSFEQSAINYARQQLGPGADSASVNALAQKISAVGADNIMGFKTDADIDEFLSTRQANAGEFTQRRYGEGIEALRQVFNRTTLNAGQDSTRRNINRAGMNNKMRLSDGSNILQRFGDVLSGTDSGSGSAFDRVLGVLDTKEIRERVRSGVTGGDAAMESVLDDMALAYTQGTYSSDEEKRQLVEGTTQANFEERKKMFSGTDAEKEFDRKTKYMTNAEVAGALTRATTADNVRDVKAIYYEEMNKNAETAITMDEVDKLFNVPEEREKAMAELAQINGIETAFASKGINTGIDASVMTQARFRQISAHTDAYKAGTNRERIQSLGQLAEQWDKGDATGKSVLAAHGISGDMAAGSLTDVMNKFMRDGGDADTLEYELKSAGIDEAQIEKIVATAQFSRSINDIGGFGKNGSSSANVRAQAEKASRKAAFEDAVKNNRIRGGRHADLVTKQQRGDKLSKEEEKELDEFYSDKKDGDNVGAFEKGLAAVDMGDAEGVESKNKEVEAIKRKAQSFTSDAVGAGSASDPTGIGTAVASAIGPAITEAFKGAVTELAKTSDRGGEFVLSGRIQIEGLEAGMAAFDAKRQKTTTPSGPVAPG